MDKNVVSMQGLKMRNAWIYLLVLTVSEAAPRPGSTQAGPCIGMDCLHGVLMHGDQQQGDGHKVEDLYESLQRQDNLKQEASRAGPCEGLDCLHNLLHDANNGDVKHMNQKIGPEPLLKQGPETVMDYMHGVLMHGDKEPGRAHKIEDEKLKKVESVHEPDGPCTDCIENRIHSGHSQHVDEDETEISTEGKHPSGGEGQRDSSTFDGNGFDRKLTDVENEKPGVFNPDSLLHQGKNVHEDKQMKNPKFGDGENEKPGVFNPDSLLHQGKNVHEDKETNNPKFGLHDEDIREKSPKQKPSTYDPHALLHDGNDDVHKRIEHIKTAAEEMHDKDDFIMWIDSKLKNGEAVRNKDDSLGFSRPFISDSVMDDIDKMKQRYLAEYNNRIEETALPDSAEKQGL